MVQVQVQTVGLLKTQQAKLDKLETEVGMLQEKINKGGADADKVCARPHAPPRPCARPRLSFVPRCGAVHQAYPRQGAEDPDGRRGREGPALRGDEVQGVTAALSALLPSPLESLSATQRPPCAFARALMFSRCLPGRWSG